MPDGTIAGDMRPNRHPLDEDSAARLLQGVVHADDAPPGYGSVAALLSAAAARPALADDAGAETIAAMVEAVRGTPAPAALSASRTSMLGKLLAGKALAAVAVVALTAGGAAAATGTLPDPVQGAVADAVSHIGVDIPHPDHGESAEHRQDADHRQDGPDDQPGEDQDRPAGPEQPDNQGQQTSDAAHDAKTGATESGGKVGPAVCTAVGSQCQPGAQDQAGDPEDKPTPPDTSRSVENPAGQPANPGADQRGADRATTPTTPTTAPATPTTATTPTTGRGAPDENPGGRGRP